jgi:predicted RNase H-like HicB family nuclease
MNKRLTAVIHREGEGFVALCPELDVASQGDTIEAARDNLREALELFFECASPAEVQAIIRQSGLPPNLPAPYRGRITASRGVKLLKRPPAPPA